MLSALELRLLAALLDGGRPGPHPRPAARRDPRRGRGRRPRPRDRPVRQAAAREAGRRPGRAALRRDGPRRRLPRGGAGGAARRRARDEPAMRAADWIATRILRRGAGRRRRSRWRSSAVGVLRVGAAAFEALMMAAGDSADHAREMFDASVDDRVRASRRSWRRVVALVLAMLLARRLARPIERLADAAAARIADGRPASARVPEEGPAELRALAGAYNVMADRLAEQEAVRREFIVNASHELRTPLTNLQGYLEALRDGVLPPDPATFDSLREEVDRLTRLAASLDVLAGAEDERRRCREDVDVGALVRGVGRPGGAGPSPGGRSRSRVDVAAGARRPGARRRAGPGRSPTSSRTRCATRPTGGEVRGDGRRRRRRRPASASRTRDRASRPTTCRGSGSASTGSRSRATASAAGPGSGSRS